MKRRLGVGVAIALALIALWWLLRDRAPAAPGTAAPQVAAHATEGGASRVVVAPRVVPAGPPASISGTVREKGKGPIAGAQVCAGTTGSGLPAAIRRALGCAFTDASGRYRIGNLLAGEYLIHASARQFRPGAYFPVIGAEQHDFALAAGEARTGVDVELERGGAEVTGVVLDALGGPIAGAEVREATRGSEHAAAATLTDAEGRFALWLDRSRVELDAIADGYAPAQVASRAPAAVEIYLTPESSLAGRVVDGASGQPVEGIAVEIDRTGYEPGPGARDVTDAQGRFRLERLSPGRYVVVARAERAYGQSAGSLAVGLAQHVDGVKIELFPAYRVAGQVVIASTRKGCEGASVSLRDREHDVAMRREPDGQRVADGLTPGSYDVSVRCPGYAARADETSIVVVDRDITGLVWEVADGGRIRGKVRLASGAAVRGASVRAYGDGGWSSSARSKEDGSYELRGLGAGTNRITVSSDRGVAPSDDFQVAVAAGATVERDLVLDDTGKVVGSVVDETGAVAALVTVELTGEDRHSEVQIADAAGAFAFDAVRPGTYRAIARREVLDKPGRKPTPVTVRAGQTATVKLAIDAERGAITGRVVDAAEQPVPDAFLSWARESDDETGRHFNVSRTRESWRDEVRPVVTAADGSFQLTRLAEGSYVVRAFRKGGGEAVAEHVAVGATVRLQIRPTASIAGVVRTAGGQPPREMSISIQDTGGGFMRTESFYMTGGRFAVSELPAGTFMVGISSSDGQGTVNVELKDGEARTGIDVALTLQVTVTGRLVESGTSKPIPGYVVSAQTRGLAGFGHLRTNGEQITNDAGRFTLRAVAVGEVTLFGYKRAAMHDAPFLNVTRTISGTGTVDIGDVVLEPRARPGGSAAP